MKSLPGEFCLVPMKEEPEEHHWSTMDSYKMNLKIMQTSKGPYLRVSHTIKENPMEDGVQWIRLPYLVGEKCLDKSTGKVVTILSCEPVRVSEVTVADAERLGVVAEWDSLSANQQENLKEKYMRDAIGEDDLFYLLWRKRHPGKEWAWRVEGKEERDA